MKTIAELKEELQGNKRKAKTWFWGHITFIHNPSIYLTYVLIKTKITANQITVIMTLCGIVGSVLLFIPNFWIKMLAFVFLYLNQILDSVDGEIARYQNKRSLRGIYVDDLQHHFVPALMIFGMVFSIIKVTPLNPDLLLYVGIVGALAWSIMKVDGKESLHLIARHFINNPNHFNAFLLKSKNDQSELTSSGTNPEDQTSIIRKIFAVRFQIRQFLFAYLMFLVAYIVEYAFLENPETHPLLYWVVFGYSVFLILHVIEEILKRYFRVETAVVEHYEQLVMNNEKLEGYDREALIDQSSNS